MRKVRLIATLSSRLDRREDHRLKLEGKNGSTLVASTEKAAFVRTFYAHSSSYELTKG